MGICGEYLTNIKFIQDFAFLWGRQTINKINMQNICQMMITALERGLCPEQVMLEWRLKGG